MSIRARALLPLFLVSMAAVGYEIALTRYFAVAKWSEYGYWVISIVMAGFALSGVLLALTREWFARRGELWLGLLPVLLILAAGIGFHLTTTNPFNPLQLQNPVTWLPQLGNIAGYYACLLPFFMLTGLFVGLSFVLNEGAIGRIYGFDLTGAGIGALAVLLSMYLLHPFALVPALLLPLLAASLLGPRRWKLMLAAVAALLASEALLLLDDQAAFNDFKAIYAPLNTPDATVVATIRSPRGLYLLLRDFTERVDTDVSNDAGNLGLPGPPATLGLYRDGNRLASLPGAAGLDVRYAASALDALPYSLIAHPRVLLAGASGGFRVAEVLALGARAVDALEPEPVLRGALERGLGPVAALPPDPRVRVLAQGPVAAARMAAPGSYDIIDLSADFLDQSEANGHAFAVEAIVDDLRALAPGGILSIPVSIREFPVYAARMLGTVRAALLAAGDFDPALQVIVNRSAWSVRILVSNAPWDAARIALVRRFCNDRSFDVSYYPGIDVAAARAGIYNDLPAVSFDAGEVDQSGGPDDAVADEAGQVLAGRATPSAAAFNLSPITFERPFFYAVLRLDRLATILRRIELLPQAEIAPLVNLAVLAQALVLALLVLVVPLCSPRRLAAGSRGHGRLRACVYFAALGLGFLFIEIFLIEKASFYLNDRIQAFSLVLTGMLIFSGLGSMTAGFFGDPRRGLALAASIILLWCLIAFFLLQPALLATLGWPVAVRVALVVVAIAPVSLALGLPFPLGLSRASGGFLPWAWGLNGAFSVIATPLANLIAQQAGFDWVLLSATILYVVALVTFPIMRKSVSWQDISAT